MKLTPQPIVTDPASRVRWVRVAIETEEGVHANILLAASRNFLMDSNRIPGGETITTEHEAQWLEMALNEFRAKGLQIQEGGVYYQVYSNSEEGKQKLIQFLRKVTP